MGQSNIPPLAPPPARTPSTRLGAYLPHLPRCLPSLLCHLPHNSEIHSLKNFFIQCRKGNASKGAVEGFEKGSIRAVCNLGPVTYYASIHSNYHSSLGDGMLVEGRHCCSTYYGLFIRLSCSIGGEDEVKQGMVLAVLENVLGETLRAYNKFSIESLTR